MKNNEGLRFAPIIRVSTEAQAQKGESLRTQKKQIIDFVERLGGSIPDHCWKYSGSESASPAQERKLLDQLLTDAGRNLFDAVICCDASRWSRDNRRNKEGLEILRKNGIRFYIGTTEYDLFNPEQAFFLSMSVEIGEFQAKTQAQKSLLNRIEKAKRGLITTGHPPTGRKKNPKTGELEVDEEMQKKIERGAQLILNGSSISEAGRIVGMNASHLRKTLLHHCGETIIQKFSNPKFKIYEEVPTRVPRLLPQETIDAIRTTLELNKTIYHGSLRHEYLLGRMILCAHCNRPLFGCTRRNRQYYYHSKGGCKTFSYIRADLIEDAVLLNLFQMYGNRAAMEEAIQAAIPDSDELKELPIRKDELTKELGKLKTESNRLVRKVAQGVVSDDAASEVLQEYADRKALLTGEISKIDCKLHRVPSRKLVGMTAQLIKRHIESIHRNGRKYAQMTFEEKRKLAQFAFSGEDPEGNRCGVYLERTESENRPWKFTIRGALATRKNEWLPMRDWEARGLLDIEDKSVDPLQRMDQLEALCSDEG